MRGPVYDVEPGAEYLIPFARKRLAQTLARTTPDCPFLRVRVFDNGTDTADIEAGRAVRRIRIRGGTTSWYFTVQEASSPASQVQQLEIKGALILDSALSPATTKLFRLNGNRSLFARAPGRSFALYSNNQDVPAATAPPLFFIEPDGSTSNVYDPLALLSGFLGSLIPASAAFGKTRKGVTVNAVGVPPSGGLSVRGYFTDGRVIQDHSADVDFTLNSSLGQVFIVGDEGEEDAYYLCATSFPSTNLNRTRLFLAERTQPVDASGAPTPIVPTAVYDGYAYLQAGSSVYAASNDYDVITALHVNPPNTGAGALEIRINGVLHWTSSGSVTGLPDGVLGGYPDNYDDSYVLGTYGSDTRFAVLTTNAAGSYVFGTTSEFGGVDVVIREILFTKIDGGYSIVENVYYLPRVHRFLVSGIFFPGGFRTALFSYRIYNTADPGYETGSLRFVWLRDGAVVVGKDLGDPVPDVGTGGTGDYRSVRFGAPMVEAFATHVKGAFLWGETTFHYDSLFGRSDTQEFKWMSFSDSESLAVVDVDVKFGADLNIISLNGHISGDDTYAYVSTDAYYVASAFAVSQSSSVVRSDGNIVRVVVNGAGLQLAPGDLRVDEDTRRVYAIIGTTRVGRVADYGNLNLGDTSRRVFVVRNSAASTVRVSTPVVPSGFTMTSSPAGEIPAGGETSFTIQIDTASAGSKSGTVNVQLTDEAGAEVQTLTQMVLGTAGLPAVNPSPPPLDGDMLEIIMKTDHSDVARFDVNTGESVEFGSGFDTFGELRLPALGAQYRGRLLAQWAAEDEALGSGGG